MLPWAACVYTRFWAHKFSGAWILTIEKSETDKGQSTGIVMGNPALCSRQFTTAGLQGTSCVCCWSFCIVRLISRYVPLFRFHGKLWHCCGTCWWPESCPPHPPSSCHFFYITIIAIGKSSWSLIMSSSFRTPYVKSGIWVDYDLSRWKSVFPVERPCSSIEADRSRRLPTFGPGGNCPNPHE